MHSIEQSALLSKNMERKISTLPRFLYLNFYALLLLFVGGGIAFIPLYKISWWLVVLQAAVIIPCLKGGIKILSSWKDKKRKYYMLMQRNAEGIRPETFIPFMQAACGRLLVRIVLKDLGEEDKFKSLKPLTKPLPERCKESCRPQKTVIHTINNLQ